VSRHDHLRVEHFIEALRRPEAAATLARRTLDHVIGLCPECRRQWEQLRRLQPVYLTALDEIEISHPVEGESANDDLDTSPEALAEREKVTAELRRLQRRAKEELWALLRLAPKQRVSKIRGARRRYRSRQLAQMLIAECRSQIHNSPADAQSIVELVPAVLRWTLAPSGPEWARALLARAAAHRANALRVGGDLPAAERAFIDLRAELAARPVGAPTALAEISALEASLRIGQRRFEEAEQLLVVAGLGFSLAGDRRGFARARINLGNVLFSAERPEEALAVQEQASKILVDEWQLETLASITGRVNALGSLGRFTEARHLLELHLDTFERSKDTFSAIVYRYLQGRVALGIGDVQLATERFSTAREMFIALGRHYDAALVSLDLAEAYRAAGKEQGLRRLLLDLVTDFRHRGVESETQRALKLLSRLSE